MTLPERIDELVKQHGSVRAAARVVRIDHAYLYRLYVGAKKEPSVAVLKRLGLRRVVTYARAQIKNDPANYLTRSKLVQQKFKRCKYVLRQDKTPNREMNALARDADREMLGDDADHFDGEIGNK